jgi:hypothetical protein
MCGAPDNRATQMSLTLTLSRQRERELEGRGNENQTMHALSFSGGRYRFTCVAVYVEDHWRDAQAFVGFVNFSELRECIVAG